MRTRTSGPDQGNQGQPLGRRHTRGACRRHQRPQSFSPTACSAWRHQRSATLRPRTLTGRTCRPPRRQPTPGRRHMAINSDDDRARSGALSGYERRLLGALCDALLPPGGAIPPGAADLGIAGDIEALLGCLRGQPRWLVRAMLFGFDLTSLLGRPPGLFHRLDAERRYRWVEASRSSRFRPRREALAGLEALVQIAYASHPQVAALIGYDGQPLVALGPAGPPPPVDLPVIKYPEVTDAKIVADVVVVGSGAGGAVAADTLARSGLDVVVLEEGPPIHRADIVGHRPAERLFEFYRDGGLTFTVGNPVISLPMGRAVGGTTVVNSGTCFRTPDAVLASWAATGIPGVSPEAMESWFEAVEAPLPLTGGGVRVEDLQPRRCRRTRFDPLHAERSG